MIMHIYLPFTKLSIAYVILIKMYYNLSHLNRLTFHEISLSDKSLRANWLNKLSYYVKHFSILFD